MPTTTDTIDEGASENYNLSVGGVAAVGTITDDDAAADNRQRLLAFNG